MFYSLALTSNICMVMQNFHIMNCLDGQEDEPTDIYVVNLKTGSVDQIVAKTLFSFHHINAYETNEGNGIVLDMSPGDPYGMRDYPLLDNMLNPPQYSDLLNGSTTGNNEVTRYHINLQTKTVDSTTFPNLMEGQNSRYVNRFDFPAINEAYRGREVIFS